MANIIFTNKCNIQCPFCFASENTANATKTKDEFSIADVWDISSSFIRNGVFRFCGGEPTLNPNMIDSVKLLLKNDKSVFIMTNGIWPDEFINFIDGLSTKETSKISYLFNVLKPDFYTENQLQKLYKVLSLINPTNATLGFTIYNEQFEYQYLIDLAKKHNINRIRWSIAAPNMKGGEYKMLNQFPKIADRIYEFLKDVKKENIETSQDCGYVPLCFFDEKKLFNLNFKLKNVSMRSGCVSSPVDIDNKGNAWRCYGMYSVMKAKKDDFKSERELSDYFNRRTKLLDNMYLFEDCKTCDYYMKSCGGGCYAIRVKRALEQNPDLELFPIDDDWEVLNCKPKREQSVTIRNKEGKKQLYWKKGNNPDIDENTVAFLEEIDGEKRIQDIINLWQGNFSNPDKATETIVQMCRNLFEMDLIEINYDYNIRYDYKKDIA